MSHKNFLQVQEHINSEKILVDIWPNIKKIVKPHLKEEYLKKGAASILSHLFEILENKCSNDFIIVTDGDNYKILEKKEYPLNYEVYHIPIQGLLNHIRENILAYKMVVGIISIYNRMFYFSINPDDFFNTIEFMKDELEIYEQEGGIINDDDYLNQKETLDFYDSKDSIFKKDQKAIAASKKYTIKQLEKDADEFQKNNPHEFQLNEFFERNIHYLKTMENPKDLFDKYQEQDPDFVACDQIDFISFVYNNNDMAYHITLESINSRQEQGDEISTFCLYKPMGSKFPKNLKICEHLNHIYEQFAAFD
jgi:hypothetical protein